MRKNASRIDANVRRIFGVLIVGAGVGMWAMGLPFAGPFFVAAGAYLILTGLLRFAPEYTPFHFRTYHEEAGPVTE